MDLEASLQSISDALSVTPSTSSIAAQTSKVKSSKLKLLCPEDGCEQTCDSRWKLKEHIRTHTGERPFPCYVCQKSFKTKHTLQTHVKSHDDVRSFQCSFEGCEKRFKLKSDLKRHSQIHSGTRRFICGICNQAFRQSDTCHAHMRRHTNDRPYECQVCSKRFVTSSKLQYHLRTHSGERPYYCTFPGCEQKFAENSSLHKHLQTHDPPNVKHYPCQLCTKAYRNSSSLAEHRRKVHVSLDETVTSVVVESPTSSDPSDAQIFHSIASPETATEDIVDSDSMTGVYTLAPSISCETVVGPESPRILGLDADALHGIGSSSNPIAGQDPFISSVQFQGGSPLRMLSSSSRSHGSLENINPVTLHFQLPNS